MAEWRPPLADASEPDPSDVVHTEYPRGYGSLGVFGAIILIGIVLDGIFGGLRSHIVGWVIAAVLLFGVDLLVIHAARSQKALQVTPTAVHLGGQFVERRHVAGLATDPAPASPVLGWPAGMPRGMQPLALRLVDGTAVLLPTKRPDRLARVLDLATTEDQANIRPAAPADLPALAEIEERASTVFRVAGHELPADLPVTDYTQAPAVAIFVVGVPPVAFARVDEVDGAAHLEELDVLPGHMRHGVGGALVEHVCAWAAERGYRAVTLCTFRDVPWNGPFYARHGFREVTDPTPGLVALREKEAAIGLDAVGTRVVMRREL